MLLAAAGGGKAAAQWRAYYSISPFARADAHGFAPAIVSQGSRSLGAWMKLIALLSMCRLGLVADGEIG
jgi:hypothetical protein